MATNTLDRPAAKKTTLEDLMAPDPVATWCFRIGGFLLVCMLVVAGWTCWSCWPPKGW